MEEILTKSHRIIENTITKTRERGIAYCSQERVEELHRVSRLSSVEITKYRGHASGRFDPYHKRTSDSLQIARKQRRIQLKTPPSNAATR